MKKTKRKRDYTSMKSIGVKSIDETFKVGIRSLKFLFDINSYVDNLLLIQEE